MKKNQDNFKISILSIDKEYALQSDINNFEIKIENVPGYDVNFEFKENELKMNCDIEDVTKSVNLKFTIFDKVSNLSSE